MQPPTPKDEVRADKTAAKATKAVQRKADLQAILNRLDADEKRIAEKKVRISAELASLG